jgi:thiamine-phosphate pyrophosphorylase
LGKDDITIKQARKILGADKIIGATSHNIKEAIKAEMDGADYISVGPMFPSPTKPHLKPEGLTYLKDIARKIKIAYVAIGGITQSNISTLLKLHKKYFSYPIKIAISSSIIGNSNPSQVTKKINNLLGK